MAKGRDVRAFTRASWHNTFVAVVAVLLLSAIALPMENFQALILGVFGVAAVLLGNGVGNFLGKRIALSWERHFHVKYVGGVFILLAAMSFQRYLSPAPGFPAGTIHFVPAAYIFLGLSQLFLALSEIGFFAHASDDEIERRRQEMGV